MVPCLFALGVLSAIGLLSVKYRPYVRDVVHCITSYSTLRPCRTSFHDRIRATTIGLLMTNHLDAARFMNRHFETVTWAFILFLYLFLGVTVYSLYRCFV
jgi:hypothetical protein